MESNLPPGVHEGMIPGNRPDDVAEDQFWATYEEKLGEAGVQVPDDAWQSDWFVEAVRIGRDMGYNGGYGEGVNDARLDEAMRQEERLEG